MVSSHYRGRHARPFLLALALFLTGCDMVSPVSLALPNLPGETGVRASSAPVVVTGDMAAREASLKPLVAQHAAEQGIPTDLVMAVIEQESGFDPQAVSGAGAQGLMQLMPGTVSDINARAPKIHVSDPFDPDQNVAGGCWYLAWVHGQVPTKSVASGDDWKFALAGYNAGIGRVQGAITQTQDGSGSRVSWDDVSGLLPAETQRYVPAIVARWQAMGDDLASN